MTRELLKQVGWVLFIGAILVLILIIGGIRLQ